MKDMSHAMVYNCLAVYKK